MPNWFQGNVFGTFGFVLVMCMVCSDCAVCSLQYFLPFFPFYQRHALSLSPSLISKQCICREMGRVSMVHHSLVFLPFYGSLCLPFCQPFSCCSHILGKSFWVKNDTPKKIVFITSLFFKQELSCKIFITSQYICWEAGTRVALKITLLLALLRDCTLCT